MTLFSTSKLPDLSSANYRFIEKIAMRAVETDATRAILRDFLKSFGYEAYDNTSFIPITNMAKMRTDLRSHVRSILIDLRKAGRAPID